MQGAYFKGEMPLNRSATVLTQGTTCPGNSLEGSFGQSRSRDASSELPGPRPELIQNDLEKRRGLAAPEGAHNDRWEIRF